MSSSAWDVIEAKNEVVKAATAWSETYENSSWLEYSGDIGPKKARSRLYDAVKAYTDLTEESPVPRFTDGKTESTAATTSPVSTPEGSSACSSPSGNFAVGDRVRFNSNYPNQERSGREGIVIGFTHSYVRVDCGGLSYERNLHALPTEIEKVPEPLKVGDRVKFLGCKCFEGDDDPLSPGTGAGERGTVTNVNSYDNGTSPWYNVTLDSGLKKTCLRANELTKITEETEVSKTGYIVTYETDSTFPVETDYFTDYEDVWRAAYNLADDYDNVKTWKYEDGELTPTKPSQLFVKDGTGYRQLTKEEIAAL